MNKNNNKERTLKEIVEDLSEISCRIAESSSLLRAFSEGQIETAQIAESAHVVAGRLDDDEVALEDVMAELRSRGPADESGVQPVVI